MSAYTRNVLVDYRRKIQVKYLGYRYSKIQTWDHGNTVFRTRVERFFKTYALCIQAIYLRCRSFNVLLTFFKYGTKTNTPFHDSLNKLDGPTIVCTPIWGARGDPPNFCLWVPQRVLFEEILVKRAHFSRILLGNNLDWLITKANICVEFEVQY